MMKTLIHALNVLSLRLYATCCTPSDSSSVHDALYAKLRDLRADAGAIVQRDPQLADAESYWNRFLDRIDAYAKTPTMSAEHSSIVTSKVSEFVDYMDRRTGAMSYLRDVQDIIVHHKPMVLWNFDDSCFFNSLIQILLSFGDRLLPHLTTPVSASPVDVAFFLGLKNLFSDRYLEHKPISDVIEMRMLLPDFWLKDNSKLNPKHYPMLANQVFSKLPFLNENAEVYILPYDRDDSVMYSRTQDLTTLLDANEARGAELPVGKNWVFIYFKQLVNGVAEYDVADTDQVSLPETVELHLADSRMKRYKLVGTINRTRRVRHITCNVWQNDYDHWYRMDDQVATPITFDNINSDYYHDPSTAVYEEM